MCVPRPSQKYDQILDAAMAEFVERGFADASMDRVSTRAEVSKRTVYKYFSSKENLFRAIVDILWGEFAEMAEFRYDPARPIRAQLTALAWAEGRILMSERVIAMARLVMSETLRNPELAEATQGRIDQCQIFADMFRAASEAGALSTPDATVAATEFLALVKARAFWPQILGAPVVSEPEMAEIVEASVEMILARYGA